MKIKEIDRTANIAWSPKSCYPIYLAVGTAAQQLDSSFSTKSALELYEFDVNLSGLDLPVKATLPCESRFHKLIWGGYGMGSEDKDKYASGIIVGGLDGGIMHVYDANKILRGKEDSLILTKNKHTGPVRALDFNSFRSHLIASGAADSEILIWDLNNPKTPMSPGTRSQPPDEVTCLAWNKQVEHILASTFSTRCVVWDLKKNEPIIKLADTTSRIKYKVVAWHPTVATQLCLGSEDDANPVIQLWDLRYATAPLKVLHGHERGVLGLGWCQDDPELLLSCGKDNRIHCWNPNYAQPGYEMVYDIPTSSQWSFDVSFCPRNPLVISTASFDGRVSIFTLSGGAQQPVTTSKLADSFPGMNMDLAHTPVPSLKPVAVQLRDAPKWLKRPCGSSFAFGGKLITFSNVKQSTPHADLPDKRVVTISQIITLPDLISRSKKLEGALNSGALVDFCQEKASEAVQEGDAKVWQFLQASFMENPNEAYLSMLGFDPSKIHEKLASKIVNEPADSLTDGFVSLGYGHLGSTNNHMPPTDNGNLLDTSRTSTRSVTPEPERLFPIHTDDTTEGLLNQALLSGNLEYAVELCLKDSRWADALILASTGGPELIKKAHIRYFHKCENEASNMIRAVVTRDMRRLVERCELDCWKQALATALTYAASTEFSYLAETLGRRLEASKNEKLKKCALLCYICCGNMNRLVDGWASDTSKSSSPQHLQELVEQVMVLKKAAEVRTGQETVTMSGALASRLVEYATLLISQGCLEAALQYVSDAKDPSIVALRERLHYSLGLARPAKTSFQPRSRQSSESSSANRQGIFNQKRPSYPSAQSPGISSIDSRRMSYFSGEPNIASLTGPPQSHFAQSVNPNENQSYDHSITNPYNPINVNTNTNWNSTTSMGKPSPYASTQQMHSDVTTAYQPTYSVSPPKNSFYNPSDSTKEIQRKDENFTGLLRTQPPITSTSSGWNDPPLLTSTAKFKSSAPSLEPITHPIFGSGPVPAEPQPPGISSGHYQPYGSGMYTPVQDNIKPAPTPMSGHYNNPPPSTFQPPPMVNPGQLYGAPQSTPLHNHPVQTNTFGNPLLGNLGSTYQPSGGIAAPPRGPPPSSSATTSWHDPPPPRSFSRPRTPAPAQLEPITHPIYGASSVEPQVSAPPTGGSYPQKSFGSFQPMNVGQNNSFPPPPPVSGAQYNQVSSSYHAPTAPSLPPPPPMGGFYGQSNSVISGTQN